jgi:hypothetical protein
MVSFAEKSVLLFGVVSMAACGDATGPVSVAQPPIPAEQQWSAAGNVLLDASTRLAPSLEQAIPTLASRLKDVSDAVTARNSANLERALGNAEQLLAGASGDAAEVDAVRIALNDARHLLAGGDR